MRIRDAGVAGVALPFCCAIIAGECVTEPGLGGGRISESMGSGEMESVSEPSRLLGTSSPLEDGRLPRASCMSSVTSLGGIREETVAFLRPGFTMGDCRMRELALLDRGGFLLLLLLLLSFLLESCCAIADSPNNSMSTSIGE